MYRNGTLVATNGYSGAWYATPPQALAIGAKLTGTTADSFWHGKLDDLALWNRSLSGDEIYQVYAAGQAGQEIALAVPRPPVIFSQSSPQTQAAGGRAVFQVNAAGGSSMTFQWRRDGNPLGSPSALTASLVLDPVQTGDAGNYDVVVANAAGAVTGAVMRLDVVQPLSPTTTGLRRDLAGYWRFDETQGNTAADSSGLHHSGVLMNAPAQGSTDWGPGRVGGALRFDGAATARYVAVPDFPKAATAYTLSAWVRASSRPAWASIAKNWFGLFHFGLDSTGGQLSNYLGTTGGGQPSVKDGALFPLDAWEHVACSADGTTLRLYRNGRLVALAPYTGTLSTTPPQALAIGAKLTGAVADSFWHGWLDEIAVWNRALGEAEIVSVYLAGTQGAGLEQAEFPAAPTALVINEFLADNIGGLQDEDRDSPDWIELYNGSGADVDLNGYCLTDDAARPDKWRFPAVTLTSGAYRVVFASGKDRRPLSGNLHTNFQLSGRGEDLLLVAPDGQTVVHRYHPPDVPAPPGAPRWYPHEPNVSFGLTAGGAATAYFPFPTPNAPNVGPRDPRGPLIEPDTAPVPVPQAGQDLVVRFRLRPDQPDGATSPSVASAALHARVDFAAETTVPLRDDGLAGDAVAGDGQWTATLPGALGAAPGRLLRWRVEAVTAAGHARVWPSHLIEDSPVYAGAVVADPSLATPLPVVHWFTADPAAADTSGGTRSSLVVDGVLFDHVLTRIRGETSQLWPRKNHKVELNPGHGWIPAPGRREVDEFDLNTCYTDKSYVRALLASELHARSGLPTPAHEPIHLRRNGDFHGLVLRVEQPDADFLERHGLDRDGALYKAAGSVVPCRLDNAAPYEKKNREDEGRVDLEALVSALTQPSAAVESWMFDHLDLPTVINFMAGLAVTQNIDASNKNYYLYCDSDGSGEWMFLPWDLDLTFGPNALNTDVLVATQNVPSTPACASHPFIGSRPWLLQAEKYNRLQEEITRNPRTRAMLVRRIRSLVDEHLASGWCLARLEAYRTQLAADVALDHARWGASSHFNWTGPGAYTFDQSLDRLRDEYLTPRVPYLTMTHAEPDTLDAVTGLGSAGIPATSTGTPAVVFGAYDARPAGGDQDAEFVEIRNTGASSVDLSGWSVVGGLSFTCKGGTVLPAGESLFVTPSRRAFRLRTAGPRGGENRLVVGDAQGHLSSLGETLELRNATGALVDTLVLPADPSDAQLWLRITEVDYHPPGDGLAEFVELTNTSTNQTLDLTGVHFSDGIAFVFGSVSLAPGAVTVVVRDLAAFRARHGAGPDVAGVFLADSSLANGGERLTLDDALGSTIQSVTYGDADPWPSAADGGGTSLHFILGSTTPPEPARWFAAAPDPGGVGVDTDTDGLSDLHEFIAGTDAGSAASVLALSVDSAGRIRFALAAGRSCAVQSAPDPAGPWTVFHVEAAGAARTLDVPAPAGERVYLRLVVPAP